ncbi:MAG: ATP-binding protein [Promethearchaeota archaeon]
MDYSQQKNKTDSTSESHNKIKNILFQLLETSIPDSILDNILEESAHSLGADSATLVLWDSEIGFINTVYNISDESTIKGAMLKPNDGGLDNRLYRERNRKYIALSNYSKNMDASKILKPLGFNYAFGIPLYIKKDVLVGTLCFYYLNRTEKISDEEIILLEEIGPIFSIAILHGKLYKEIYHLEEKENKTKNFLNLLLNSSPDIIINVDLIGKIIFWNKAAENSTNFMLKEIKNKKIPLASGKNEEIFYELLTQVRKNKTFIGKNFLFKTKSKKKREESTPRTINLSLIPVMDKSKKIDSILITGKDISETEHLQNKIYEYHLAMKNKDEEILSSQEKIRSFQEDLKEAQKLAMIGQISTLLSHQINNPLMSIISTLAVLNDDFEEFFDTKYDKITEDDFSNASDLIKKQIDAIVKEGNRIKNVLKDLRLFSEITKEKHFRKNTDLVEVIAQTINDIKARKKYKDVKIKFIKDINRSKIYGNFSQLKYVIQNIIENAYLAIKLKKGNKNKGLIQIIIENILEKQKKLIRISINDNGIGIEKEEMKNIFEPFYSNWEQYKTYNYELEKYHIGLSLTIIRTIVLNHFGQIYVKSPIKLNKEQQEAIGTAFVLEFPENIENIKQMKN